MHLAVCGNKQIPPQWEQAEAIQNPLKQRSQQPSVAFGKDAKTGRGEEKLYFFFFKFLFFKF